jgi:hypothetical protein
MMLDALRQAPGTRPERYTILSEMDLSGGDALELLERAFG